jgi:hypothetical protein
MPTNPLQVELLKLAINPTCMLDTPLEKKLGVSRFRARQAP